MHQRRTVSYDTLIVSGVSTPPGFQLEIGVKARETGRSLGLNRRFRRSPRSRRRPGHPPDAPSLRLLRSPPKGVLPPQRRQKPQPVPPAPRTAPPACPGEADSSTMTAGSAKSRTAWAPTPPSHRLRSFPERPGSCPPHPSFGFTRPGWRSSGRSCNPRATPALATRMGQRRECDG